MILFYGADDCIFRNFLLSIFYLKHSHVMMSVLTDVQVFLRVTNYKYLSIYLLELLMFCGSEDKKVNYWTPLPEIAEIRNNIYCQQKARPYILHSVSFKKYHKFFLKHSNLSSAMEISFSKNSSIYCSATANYLYLLWHIFPVYLLKVWPKLPSPSCIFAYLTVMHINDFLNLENKQ